jgi:hypothetical protein
VPWVRPGGRPTRFADPAPLLDDVIVAVIGSNGHCVVDGGVDEQPFVHAQGQREQILSH